MLCHTMSCLTASRWLWIHLQKFLLKWVSDDGRYFTDSSVQCIAVVQYRVREGKGRTTQYIAFTRYFLRPHYITSYSTCTEVCTTLLYTVVCNVSVRSTIRLERHVLHVQQLDLIPSSRSEFITVRTYELN